MLLSGVVYTARDAAHARMMELLDKGEELPFPIEGAAVYYVGPTPERPGCAIGAAGPTTSGRMDAYPPRLLDLGLACMIGKGKRSEAVKQSVVKNGAVYLAAIGGAGALMANSVQSCEIIAWPDLGCEAVRKLVVKDFLLTVLLDTHGGDLYQSGPAAYLASLTRLKRRLLLCGLALVVSVAAAILLVVSANAKRARLQAESEAAASAAQAAAESEAAAKAASEAAAREAAEAAARAEEEAKQKRANQVAAASEAHENTRYGDKLGRIWVEGTNVDCDLYLGDSETQFSRGAGCHAEDDCVLPGENGTVFIGAHTGTYFSDLGSCEIGAIIHLETTWGDFAYKITDMQVILETDIDKVRWGAEEPSCILYTCYPFGILTHTTQRYAVYADPVETDEYGVVADVDTGATNVSSAAASNSVSTAG